MRDSISLCIVGWYGTETLGDRAILDGIIYIYKQFYKDVIVRLGSLYPFYSQRTLYEEADVFQTVIEVFDVKDVRKLRQNVKQSDCVIVGGGPIMDNIKELYIIYKAFKYGKRLKKRNIIFGCGLGPLLLEEYINITHDILQLADMIIYRDIFSLNRSNDLFGKFENEVVCGDPAIISICRYRDIMQSKKENSVSLNFRRYPNEYGNKSWISQDILNRLINKLSQVYEIVYLVPMHSFFIGGDDREYLYEVLNCDNRCDNVSLIGHGLNLKVLYETYMNSEACIGMRYHSVVMQTILNGNNYILNYTDKQNGKIEGFLEGLENREFYENRIFNGDDNEKIDIDNLINILSKKNRYQYEVDYGKLLEVYINILK